MGDISTDTLEDTLWDLKSHVLSIDAETKALEERLVELARARIVAIREYSDWAHAHCPHTDRSACERDPTVDRPIQGVLLIVWSVHTSGRPLFHRTPS